MQAYNTGKLIIKPLEATLTHNTDIFTNMDPYCKILCGSTGFMTDTHKLGGKHPKWTETFTMQRTTETSIDITIYDRDLLTADDLIGSCSINLEMIIIAQNYSNWIPLQYKGKDAGLLKIDIVFMPDISPPFVASGGGINKPRPAYPL